MVHQIEEVLSRERWENIKIREKYEPLVEIEETDVIRYGSHLGPTFEGNSYFVRMAVAEMLRVAALLLPLDYRLVIIEGVRNIERQQLLYDHKCQEISVMHPEMLPEEIARQARLVVAAPSPLANHNCGGAVDVTIERIDGTLVDMGTMPHDVTDPKILKMFSLFITHEQKANRKILRTAMIKAGFVFYPGEWWHYCYDDRMYAVYTGRKECHYGPIQALFEAK